jgi:uncharacterized membrane protein
MALTFTAPGALWLLLVVPAVWLALRFSRVPFGRAQQRLQAAVRSTLLAALVVALARPVVSMATSQLSVVYAVDVSHSVASRAIARAADRIDELQRELRPAHHRIVVFGLEPAVVPDTGALRALAAADPAERPDLQRHGTDIESALATARAELAAGHVHRLVLFSDGRETRGDLRESAARLAREGIALSIDPLEVRDLGDAWIDGLLVPQAPAAGAAVTVRVVVGSQRAARASLEIRDRERPLARQEVALEPGLTTIPIEVAFSEPGARAVEARLTVEGDPLEPNNALAGEVVVQPRTHVLYVEGAAGRAGYLQRALEQGGIDVTVAAPGDVPVSRDGFDPWDVVILSDVARVAIRDDASRALADWVERGGGGLFFAGGTAVFGEGEGGPPGYRGSEIERLLPVTFERRDEPDVALLIVLDRSWSMAGDVMEICKAAAQAAIDVLADEQTVGVLTFNDSFAWDVNLGNVGVRREAIRAALRAIEPAGHTLMFPALEQAYLALLDARAKARHVVLLSDGRSYPDEFETLVEKMVAAKITVSSIAVGPAADRDLLANIAKWGRGRSYVVEDAREVPQIFVQEAENVATPAFDEEATRPVLEARGFLEGIDFTRVPALRGRTALVLKDDALQLVATADGDPLLAFWPVGLGRSAAFASDVKNRWAIDWLSWRGYAPFFTAVVRALARQRPPGLVLDVAEGPVRGTTRPVHVRIEARDASGQYEDLLAPVVRVSAGGREPIDVPASQRGPGRYEVTIPADASEPLALTVAGQEPAAASRLILPDPHAEYRFRAPDEALLRRIAAGTGGAWQPTAESLRASARDARSIRRALWPGLVLLGLGLWMVDILLRRVRVFDGT